MSLLRPDTAHEELVRAAVDGRLSEEDALVWMVLLHTHEMHLQADAVCDSWRSHAGAGHVVLAAQTRRVVAAVIASLWKELMEKRGQPPDEQRSNYAYWYWQYSTRVPYEVIEAVPTELLPRLQEFRDVLARDPRVLAVVAED